MAPRKPKADAPQAVEPVATSSSVDVQYRFNEKVEATMRQIGDIQSFRESDEMVDYVFKVGRRLFDIPLDKMQIGELLDRGGKLVGAYPYLGQKSMYARAKRDVYEARMKELEKELFLDYVDGSYKVTEVKAQVSDRLKDVYGLVQLMEAEKNKWEAITDACQTMVMFCQSALRIKEKEGYASSRMHDQP